MSLDFDHSNFDPARVALPELQCAIWTELTHACGSPHHPWRLPCLANVFQNAPQQRTVVLRHVDHASCQLFAHTDVRTAKIEQLRENPAVSWHFYHPGRRIQLIMTGTAKLHVNDVIADHDWAQLEPAGQIPYLAPQPPGQPAGRPSVNLPDAARSRVPSEEERAEGRAHFAVIAAKICEIDLLFLRVTGHLRAKFVCDQAGWQRTWVQP